MSAHIAIRCDECGKMATDDWMQQFHELENRVKHEGWTIVTSGDLCPFCAARRKAEQQAEAAAK